MDFAKLDYVTLKYLEYQARVHIAAHDSIKTEAEAIEWADRGEALADAVDFFRAIVKPDPIAAAIKRGMAR